MTPSSDFDLGLLQKRCALLCADLASILEHLEKSADQLGYDANDMACGETGHVKVLGSVADVFVAGLMLAALHQTPFAAVVQARLVDLEAKVTA